MMPQSDLRYLTRLCQRFLHWRVFSRHWNDPPFASWSSGNSGAAGRSQVSSGSGNSRRLQDTVVIVDDDGSSGAVGSSSGSSGAAGSSSGSSGAAGSSFRSSGAAGSFSRSSGAAGSSFRSSGAAGSSSHSSGAAGSSSLLSDAAGSSADDTRLAGRDFFNHLTVHDRRVPLTHEHMENAEDAVKSQSAGKVFYLEMYKIIHKNINWYLSLEHYGIQVVVKSWVGEYKDTFILVFKNRMDVKVLEGILAQVGLNNSSAISLHVVDPFNEGIHPISAFDQNNWRYNKAIHELNEIFMGKYLFREVKKNGWSEHNYYEFHVNAFQAHKKLQYFEVMSFLYKNSSDSIFKIIDDSLERTASYMEGVQFILQLATDASSARVLQRLMNGEQKDENSRLLKEVHRYQDVFRTVSAAYEEVSKELKEMQPYLRDFSEQK